MPYTFKYGDRPIDGVTVQRAIGRGGFGEVYYAVADSGKELALKYLRENPEIELRGIGHVMNLKSPHLITIYDVRRNEANEPFVLMEYVSGPSLRDLMVAEGGALGVQKAAFFLKGICDGLSYLHARGVVHRDLKPANIFYDDGYVKIGDYGLSKHMSVSKHSGQTVSVGTVHYMAPEIGSGSYTKAIDIYALGVILYEMLMGALPFSGSSMGEILMRHLRDRPDLTGVPAPFAPIIAKALEKDPEDRYADADEMLAAVMDCADINTSADSFDASALTQVPRQPEAESDEATLTSPPPPPPVPTLDVREPAAVEALPPRLQKKLDRFSKRLEGKARRLEKRFGAREAQQQPPRRHVAAAPPAAQRMDMPEASGGSRVAQVFLLLVVTVAISAVLAVMQGATGGPEAGFGLFFFLWGGTLGPLVMHLAVLQRIPGRSWLIDRVAYASAAGFFMLPAFALGTEVDTRGEFSAMIVAPMAAMVFCDWARRLEAGRAGEVNGWEAFWPALVGLIAAAIADADGWVLVAAAITGAISLLTQSLASVFPERSRLGRVERGGGQHGVPLVSPHVARADQPVTPMQGMGARPAGGPPATGVAQADVVGAAAAHGARQREPGYMGEDAARPSFAGRRGHSGYTILGKLLLLAALAAALGRGPLEMHGPELVVGGELASFVSEELPVGVVVSLLLLGGLMLVFGRVGQGPMHLLRGLAGCLLMVVAGVFGMIGARESLTLLAAGNVEATLATPMLFMPLVLMAILLGSGLLLLWWPRRDPNRPIVV